MFRLVLSYDGTDFAGSQIQPGVRTVQGELEAALTRIARGSVRTTFAGRTDRGVHAAAQVVSAQIEWRATVGDLRRALNSELPQDVAVVDADGADRSFHARFDALWREYRYAIVEAQVRPVLESRYAWWLRDRLDVQRGRAAAGWLIGDRAFGSFAGAGASRQLPADKLRRRVYAVDWAESQSCWPAPGGPERRHIIRVVANGFLPNMVRNMVAGLVAVARGQYEPDWVQSVVGANDRRALECAPAPPEGLVLWQVGYQEYDSSREEAARDGFRNAGHWCGAFECQCA